MSLQLKGEHKVALNQERVWCLLNDPAVLQEVIPGCDKLTHVGEDKYELALGLLIGSVSGNYKGSVALSDKKPLQYYDLTLSGEGSIGFVKGHAHFALMEQESDTIITYDGEAEVGGLVAGVGNRMLGGVAKFMVKRFFKAFDVYIKEHDISGFTPADPGGATESARFVAPVAAVETLVDVGGASLRVLIDGKEGAPWLVMSHSIMANSHIFDEQVAAFGEQFHILRIDTRGHGGSEASLAPYEMSLLVQDVVKVLDHFDVDKAHFLGLSLGGMIGYGLALAYPQRVRSLVIASARADAPDGFAAVWDGRIAAVRQGGMETLITPTIERWFAPDFLVTHAETRTRIGTMMETVSPQGFEGCARALQVLNYLPNLNHIQIPTLLIAGARDTTIPEAMLTIHGEITESRFEVIANSGHIPNVDNTAEFNQIVAQFLAQVVA